MPRTKGNVEDRTEQRANCSNNSAQDPRDQSEEARDQTDHEAK